MNFDSFPAQGLQAPRWAPYQAPLRARASSLGQAAPVAPPAPVQVAPNTSVTIVQQPPVPFIDGAFFNLLFDGAIVTAGGIAGTAFWRQSKESRYPSGNPKSDEARKGDKRTAWFFYGIAALGGLKGILDASRLMR